MKKILSTLILGLAWAAASSAEEFAGLRKTLSERMPEVTLGEIRKLPTLELYEVQANGMSVFYTDARGELAFIGELIETKTRNNLTQARKQELMKADFATLPMDKAIVNVKGDGSRKLAVFSDPDCPYCRQLEQELAGLSNVTIYTFLFPLAQLHPDAARKARLVWCAPDRAKAWEALMLKGTEPPAAGTDCEAPLGAIAEVAKNLWIQGTPGMIFPSGRLVPGVLPKAEIESLLAGTPKS